MSDVPYPAPPALPTGQQPVVGGPGGATARDKILQILHRLWLQYRWFMVSGGSLVILAVAGLAFGLYGGDKPTSTDTTSNTSQTQQTSDSSGSHAASQGAADSSATNSSKPADTKDAPKTGGGTSGSSNGGGSGASGGSSGGIISGGGSCSGTSGAPGGADPWGGCWPGSNNTGVPAGTTLTRVPQDATSGSGWSWDGGDGIVNVTGSNATLSGLDVSGGMYVTATGVTIKNSRARYVQTAGSARYCHTDEDGYAKTQTGCATGVANAGSDPRLTIQDSEIDCHGVPGNTGTGIGDRNVNVVRVNIHGCENGFDIDTYSFITDSYIHDLYNSAVGDPHTDGLQSGIGSFLVITHNVFYGFTTGCTYPNNNGSCNGTSAINIGGQPDHATSANTTVKRNLLAGGAYTLYCPILTPSNFQITENHFSRVYSPKVGEYGPTDGCAQGEIASGNVYHETGLPVTME